MQKKKAKLRRIESSHSQLERPDHKQDGIEIVAQWAQKILREMDEAIEESLSQSTKTL